MHELLSLPALIRHYKESDNPPIREERESERSASDILHEIEQILPELEKGDLKKLLDPCVVLVMAGYKPETFLYKGPLQTSSEIFRKYNIDVWNGCPISLVAARNRLRESKLMHIILNNQKINVPMTVEQYNCLAIAIADEAYQMIGSHTDIFQIIIDGIMLGYPDQAILDFATAYLRDIKKGDSHEHRSRLSPAGIVEGNEKLEYLLEYFPSPDFDVAPEHANDPSVVSASTRQREFLEKFYSLPEVITMLESVGIQKTEYQDVEIIKG